MPCITGPTAVKAGSSPSAGRAGRIVRHTGRRGGAEAGPGLTRPRPAGALAGNPALSHGPTGAVASRGVPGPVQPPQDQAPTGRPAAGLDPPGQVASRRACMGCRALQAPSTGTLWASQRAVARRGRPPEVRMPAVPSSPCPRPRPAFGVQCPVRAPSVRMCLSGVRCGRPVSVRSRVRCPTGVRSWSAAVGQAARRLRWLGRRGRPPYPYDRLVSAQVRAWARSWRRPCGPAEASARTWPSS
jgi:hypothetical protein